MIEISGLFSQTRIRLSEKPKIIRFGPLGPELGGSVDLPLFTDITSRNSPNRDLTSLIEAEFDAGSNATTATGQIPMVNELGRF